MAVIQIGSFAIMIKWLILAIGLVIGLIVLKIWLRRTQQVEVNKRLFDILLNSLFIGFFAWKGSLILLEPQLILKSPISLLYFTGGTKGLLLAIIVSVFYFVYKSIKATITKPIIIQSLLIFGLTTVTGFQVISYFILEDYALYHLFIAVITLFLLILIIVRQGIQTIKGVLLMYKNVIIILGLLGLIVWVVYDSKFSNVVAEKNIEENVEINNERVEYGIQEGNKAIDFELTSIDGRAVKLSDMEGKKVILNFWATWCPPCKAEMPHMQDFYEEQQGKDVEIIAVNLTTAEKNKNDVEPFVKDYGLTFPILLDSEGDIGSTYQAFTIPTSYVIDTKGIIRKKIIGPMDKEMMYKLVESVD
ncbi:peroxiredoxin family protein [Ferdinandcohnia quinoae]|uniref:TlpA family protein disulfide reductase n=1 Tax=Fredinandcohnia quinoae TaxID=2918902 RepID=A0AAW5DYA4_9BACI|nr:TlpA disulfide reductase family protein [Fredinandcohnia sp. SECRCQ15]MCH1625620.1 TlpA family protein disulfide reductase [Fredinandcohnia sp. SECRCQ15]